MIKGKVIQPSGSSGKRANDSVTSSGLSKRLRKLRGLFHSAPAAMTGNSSKVMDHCMKYHREHCGS